jgi:hypothetical protein
MAIPVCLRQQGHSLDFVLATSFLILYYVRPHEWMSSMSSLQPITKVMAAALVAVFFYTGRRAEWRPRHFLTEFVRTPNDWIMIAFVAWILHASGDAKSTWGAIYPLLAYYIVVEHSLSTPRRMEIFAWVWLGLLLFLSTMAVLSEFEIDPFGSYDVTHGMYEGRLCLNLSIFKNPNALGHSVVMIVPMIWFLGIWHRVLLLKELSLPLFAMPFWCVYWTQSKGAFISGAVAMLASQAVGRPKWVQLAVVAVAYVVGTSALLLLPRMHELESIRNDPGVRGRLAAWNFAWESFESLPEGLGYHQFTRRVPVFSEGRKTMRKAAHSSYVEVAAELGKTGLYLWLGVIYFCFRGLLLCRTQTDQEERLRRLLFCLVVIYMASSWMTNISYRGTFFIQTGVVAAFCRHMRRDRGRTEADDEDEKSSDVPVSDDSRSVELDTAEAPSPAVTAGGPESGEESMAQPSSARMWSKVLARPQWRHVITLAVDAALIYVLYWAVIQAWLYFMLDWTGI